MKPVQSSVPELMADLSVGQAAKNEAAQGDSFQAVLAMALQSLIGPTPSAPVVKVEPAGAGEAPAPALPDEAPEGASAEAPAISAPVVAGANASAASRCTAVEVPAVEPVAPQSKLVAPKASAHRAEPEAPVAPPKDEAKAPEEASGMKAAPLALAGVVPLVLDAARPPTREKGEPERPRVAAGEESRPRAASAMNVPARRAAPSVSPPALPSGTLGLEEVAPEKLESKRAAEHAQAPDRPSPAPRVESHSSVSRPMPNIAARVVASAVGDGRPPAPAAPPVREGKLQPDVEPLERPADSHAGAPRADALLQQQRTWQEDTTVPMNASTEVRHHDEPPGTPGGTDRVTLHLPDEAGGGRVHIAVRGDVVHARIVPPDAIAGHDMESGLGDLRSALGRQGFEEAHVRVETRSLAQAGGGSQERHEREARQPEDPWPDARRQQPDRRSHQRSRRERER